MNIPVDEFAELYLVQNLKLKDLAVKYGFAASTLSAFIKKHGLQKQTNIRHNIKHTAFSDCTNKSAYWAGFIAADGNIYADEKGFKVKVSTKDERHLHKLCRFLERDTGLYKYSEIVKGKVYESSTLMVYSPQIVGDLKTVFNIIRNKTYTLQPPTLSKDDHISHYIRGFMDGDGCVTWNKASNQPRLHFIGASKPILEWIRVMLNTYSGIKSRAQVRHKEDEDYYELEFGGNNKFFGFTDYIYTNSTPETRLTRKYDRYKKYGGTI